MFFSALLCCEWLISTQMATKFVIVLHITITISSLPVWKWLTSILPTRTSKEISRRRQARECRKGPGYIEVASKEWRVALDTGSPVFCWCKLGPDCYGYYLIKAAVMHWPVCQAVVSIMSFVFPDCSWMAEWFLMSGARCWLLQEQQDMNRFC